MRKTIKHTPGLHLSRYFTFLILMVFTLLFTSCEAQTNAPTDKVQPAAYQLNQYVDLLEGKRIGMVVNPTSEIAGTHLVDTLRALDINITRIFAPEHGFRGTADAGEKIDNSIDSKTGIKIISLYGSHRKPTADDLKDIDVVIFDIQDVGLRFYTYISTMHYVMEACAENNKQMIVLDRPNPNGYYVDGPVLDLKYQSFVGMHAIPIVHGLTVGELALMINNEQWLSTGKCELKVIKMDHYSHIDRYSLPVKPSPNLPNDRSIQLYASLCLLEPTLVSIGRGTTYPFQVFGYPDQEFGSFAFTPESINGMSKYPKYEDKTCYGTDLRRVDLQDGFNLEYLLSAYLSLGVADSFFTSPSFFDKLAGTNQLRTQMLAGASEAEIRDGWEPALKEFMMLRKKYLLYPDFE